MCIFCALRDLQYLGHGLKAHDCKHSEQLSSPSVSLGLRVEHPELGVVVGRMKMPVSHGAEIEKATNQLYP